ncbi:MAG: Autotransporter-associated beta strand repeat protein [Pedosphaera sp.]|nr:Autotransporter-associated beta strand repeat protein [Pedosphaera sp.]
MKIKSQFKVLSLLALAALAVSSAHAVLIGHWPMNDATNTWAAADTSGNGMTATNTLHARMTFGNTGAPIGGTAPFGGTCVSFVGGQGVAGNELAIPSFSSINGATKLTISLWFQSAATQPGGTTYYGLFMARAVTDNIGTGKNYGLAINQSAAPNWSVEGRITGTFARSGAVYASSAIPWTHVVMVWDGAGHETLYLNGVQAATTAVTLSSITTGGAWYFGWDSSNPFRHLAGQIDDCAAWSDALSASQINQIYTNGLQSGIDAVSTIQGAGSTWAATGGGNWSSGANWSGNVSPNSTTIFAAFGGSILAPSTVTNNTANSINNLIFNNSANSYTLGGSSTLTLGGTTPTISVVTGSHTVKTPLATSGTALTLSVAGTLNMGSESYADGTIISGNGVVVVTNLANGGSASGIGASANSAANLTLSGGTLKYIGSAAGLDRSFQLDAGVSTIDASGTGALNWNNSASAIGYTGAATAKTLQLTGTNTGNNTLSLSLGDGTAATSLIKNGSGTWVFGNSANNFTGPTTISQGTLKLSALEAVASSSTVSVAAGATLDVSAVGGFALGTNQKLQGSGTVVGSLTSASGNTISPGGDGAAGTLTFSNDLSLADGNINVDLAALTNGTSDQIVVDGSLNLSGTTTFSVSLLNPLPSLQAGSYVVMHYTGSLTGTSANFAVANTTVYGITVSIDTTAKTVSLVVAPGTLPTYTWVGDNSVNYWSLTTPFSDWTMDGGATTIPWRNGANVVFDDSSSGFPIHSYQAAVLPSSVTVNANANSYRIDAVISGSTAVTNNGTATLWLNAPNTYTGGTVVNAGTVKLGNNNGMGAVASDASVLATIASGATLDLNGWGLQNIPGRVVISGTGVDGNGALVCNHAFQAANAVYNVHILDLAGDTTVATANKIAILGTSTTSLDARVFLNGHTLTKVGTGGPLYFGDGIITNGNLVIAEGEFDSWGSGIQVPTSTTVFSVDTSLTVSSGATWAVGLNGGNIICNASVDMFGTVTGRFSGTVVFGGPMKLETGYVINPAAAGTFTFLGPVQGVGQPLNQSYASTTINLQGTNTYTGNTVISAGTLTIATNGSIATSPVIDLAGGSLNVAAVTGGFNLASGQTLSGSGTTTGKVTIQSGGTLSPGESGVGTLTFTDNLTNNGTILMDVNSTGTSDSVINTGATNAYGGTLQINNLGPMFALGDSFTLFSTNGVGSFAAFSPTHPNDDTTLAWQFTPTNGVLSIVSAAVISTNAYLTALTLTPAGVLSPGFATNGFTYWATNAYANNLVTVTATSADTNATLQLSFNGGAFTALTNNQASGSRSLNLTPSPVNVVAVLVTAQDSLTTNLYTVNVLLQPNQSAFMLTNNVIGGTNLLLTWPLDHTGFRLLVQTNNLNKGVSSLTNDWGTVSGSTATNSASITILKTNLNEYYRLVYP